MKEREGGSELSSRIETGSCFYGAIAAEMHGEPFWICYVTMAIAVVGLEVRSTFGLVFGQTNFV